MNNRIIIIGGMGPQASLSLHERLITRAAQCGARDGNEFPEIAHLSLPVTDFISQPAAMAGALELITDRIRCLYLWRRNQAGYCL